MWIRGVEFYIGADPEVFVQNKKTKRFIGAHGLVAGTKRYPMCLPRSRGCTGQVDGMALEFNTPPSPNAGWFSRRITGGKRGLSTSIPLHLSILVQPTAEFDKEEWERAPEEAVVLGCEPDFCAWGGVYVNEPPDANVSFRTGAGHIHLGWGKYFEITEDFKEICAALVREQDSLNGLASLLYDQDTKRRELYGRAGAFRPKSYGVEYRTLSNSWVRCQELSRYVARRTFQAAKNMMKGNLIQIPEVEEIINSNNTEEAKYFLIHNKVALPPNKYRVV